MRKQMFAAVLVCCVIALLVSSLGCATTPATPAPAAGAPKPAATPAPAAAKAPIVAKLSHSYPDNHARNIQALKFKELVEKHTNGRLKVDVFPAGQLFGAAQEMNGLLTNSIQFAQPAGPGLVGIVGNWAILQLPLAFPAMDSPSEGGRENVDLYIKFMGSDMFKELAVKPFEAKGYRYVAWADVGVLNPVYLNNVRPINKVEDFKGLKIRTPGGEMLRAWMEAVGIAPITIAVAEVVTAVQTGMVDGVLTMWSAAASWNLDQKYGLDFGTHGGAGSAVISNMTFWNSLPADIQKIMSEKVTPEFEAWNKEFALKADIEDRAKWIGSRKPVMTKFDAAEKKKYEAAMKPVYDKYVYSSPDMTKLLNAMRALVK